MCKIKDLILGIENKSEENKCIGCGGLATRTNNTLCIECWHDAEGDRE